MSRPMCPTCWCLLDDHGECEACDKNPAPSAGPVAIDREVLRGLALVARASATTAEDAVRVSPLVNAALLVLAASDHRISERKPLTDEDIYKILDDVLEGGSLVDVARAVERAHGIGGRDE